MKDLSTQQLTLATSDYDLRITNLARFILKKLPIKQGSFIDVGAGNGLFLKFFKDRGFEVEGIELEKDQVHEMRKDFKLKDVKISQGDITNLHGKESYDVVIASDVIEHIQNDEVALTNLFTFVKKGGYLVLTVPAHMHLYGKRDKIWGHYRRYDKQDLVRKLQSLEGCKVVNVSYWNVLGYFAYFFFERIMQQPIKESFRYKQNMASRIIRAVTDGLLKIEELVGGAPVGLTLVAISQKKKND